MTYGGLAPSPTPTPVHAPVTNTQITAQQTLVTGIVILVIGAVMLFFVSGGPGVAAERWSAFKSWLFRMVAYGLLFLGAYLIFEATVRS